MLSFCFYFFIGFGLTYLFLFYPEPPLDKKYLDKIIPISWLILISALVYVGESLAFSGILGMLAAAGFFIIKLTKDGAK